MRRSRRNQRDRGAHGVVVEVRTDLAADLQHVAEAFCCDQAGGDAAALNDHIGRDRGAVADEAELVRRDPMRGHQGRDAIGDGLRGVGGRGRQLEVVQRAGGEVVQSEVREGATDVETDAKHEGPVSDAGSMARRGAGGNAGKGEVWPIVMPGAGDRDAGRAPLLARHGRRQIWPSPTPPSVRGRIARIAGAGIAGLTPCHDEKRAPACARRGVTSGASPGLQPIQPTGKCGVQGAVKSSSEVCSRCRKRRR